MTDEELDDVARAMWFRKHGYDPYNCKLHSKAPGLRHHLIGKYEEFAKRVKEDILKTIKL